MHHELKIAPAYFQAVLDGNKTFEIRQNDRGFQKGDRVNLREYDAHRSALKVSKYTGRQVDVEITYVTAFEQKPGWVVFGFSPVDLLETLRAKAQIVAGMRTWNLQGSEKVLTSDHITPIKLPSESPQAAMEIQEYSDESLDILPGLIKVEKERRKHVRALQRSAPGDE